MEKKLGINQDYVNRITTMLEYGMIPPGNSDIIHRFLLWKTRQGEEIRTLRRTRTGTAIVNSAAKS